MSTSLRQPAASFHAENPVRVLDVDVTQRGLWRVSSRDRNIGGIFVSRQAALAFAHDEGEAQPRAVVVIHDGNTLTEEEFVNHAHVATTRLPSSAHVTR